MALAFSNTSSIVLNSKASPDSALVSVVIKTFGLVQSKEYARYTTLAIA